MVEGEATVVREASTAETYAYELALVEWRHLSAKSKIRAIATMAFVGFLVVGGPTVHGNPLAIAAFFALLVGYSVSYARIGCPRWPPADVSAAASIPRVPAEILPKLRTVDGCRMAFHVSVESAQLTPWKRKAAKKR